NLIGLRILLIGEKQYLVDLQLIACTLLVARVPRKMIPFGDIRASQNMRCNGDYNIALTIGCARSREEAPENRDQPNNRQTANTLGFHVLADAGDQCRLAVLYASDGAH